MTTTICRADGELERRSLRGLSGVYVLVDRRRHIDRSDFEAGAGNTPPLGQPNGTFGSAAFGSIATAGDPRVFELVLKVRF